MVFGVCWPIWAASWIFFYAVSLVVVMLVLELPGS